MKHIFLIFPFATAACTIPTIAVAPPTQKTFTFVRVDTGESLNSEGKDKYSQKAMEPETLYAVFSDVNGQYKIRECSQINADLLLIDEALDKPLPTAEEDLLLNRRAQFEDARMNCPEI